MNAIKKAVLAKGYHWFEEKYHLNLVAVRKNNQVPNTFDDMFTISYFDGQDWQYSELKCTVDPGLYWLKNPENVKGTAILVPGQYLDSWQLGFHRGQYKALTQAKPVSVWRDADRDNLLDHDCKKDTGLFGINIHRANEKWESTLVDKWSAGCTVISNPNSFAKLIVLVSEAYRLGYRFFTYTLLDEQTI